MSSMIGNKGMTGGGKNTLTGGNRLPKGYEAGQFQQYTPEQMELLKRRFASIGPQSYTSRLAEGEEGIFDEMEAPAHRQFQGAIGQLGSRFAGFGSGFGGLKSSGFQNKATAAASNFSQDLQAKRMELRNQAIEDLHRMSQDLLGNRPYEQFMIKKPQKKSWWQSAGEGILPVAGAAVGGIFGGPAGAALGAKVGGAAGQGFFGGRDEY